MDYGDLDSLLALYQAWTKRSAEKLSPSGEKLLEDFIKRSRGSLKKYLNRLYTQVLLKSKRKDLKTVVLLLLICILCTYAETLHEADIGCLFVNCIELGMKPSENALVALGLLPPGYSEQSWEVSMQNLLKSLHRHILENT